MPPRCLLACAVLALAACTFDRPRDVAALSDGSVDVDDCGSEVDLPSAVAVDDTGNLYIADMEHQRVRRIDGATGVASTVAGTGVMGSEGDGGAAINAQLAGPAGVAVDGPGNLYIADYDNERIRRVDRVTGIITTIAGSDRGFAGDGGAATSARLAAPRQVAVHSLNNFYIVYIADSANHRIRRIDATETITTVAGTGEAGFSGDGGPATSARLNSPNGVTVDDAGNLYIADGENRRIRRVDAVTGTITTFAGTGMGGFSGDGGVATSAQIERPQDVAVTHDSLYIADAENQRVRRVSLSDSSITTIVGTGIGGFSGDGGQATSAQLANPAGVAIDAGGNLFIADEGNGRIRRVDVTTGVISSPGHQCPPR